MIKPKDKVIVGLSGGKDSIALLYNLKNILDKWHDSKPITALTIDEGIKDYRENSIDLASKFCKEYDIEHKIVSFKEKVEKTLNEIVDFKKKSDNYQYACNYCATFRRRFLNDGAKDLGGTVLALGHNITDIAETYLMNILFKRHQLIANQYFFKERTDDINKYFLRKVSPLMKIPEEEVFLYVNIKKLDYYRSHCPYREIDPIVRKKVLDFIQTLKKDSPEIEFNLLNGFLELSGILYENLEKIQLNHCEKCGYPCGNNKKCVYCTYLEDLS